MVLGKARNQRGAGSIGCLFLSVIIAAGCYAGYQFGMPRLRHGSFEDRMTETTPHFQKASAESIRTQIIQIATEFDIALTPEQVKVSTTGSKLKIDLAYEKLIDLKVWQTTVRFELHRYLPYY